MTVGEDSDQHKTRKKQCFLVATILFLFFIGKMASLSRLEGLFLDVASYTLNNWSF